MLLKSFVCGSIQNNCFVLNNENSKDALIIDPGYPNKNLEDYLGKNALDVKYIILTHGHSDHTGGIKRIRELYPDVKLIAGKKEARLLYDRNINFGHGGIVADINVTDGDSLDLCGIHIKVIETPGHTAGGICLYLESEKILFSGDTLFFCSIGRTDLPTGSYDAIISSIKDKLFKLPGDTTVLPGHGPETNIEFERNSNPFVN